jgi:hypothetical protein
VSVVNPFRGEMRPEAPQTVQIMCSQLSLIGHVISWGWRVTFTLLFDGTIDMSVLFQDIRNFVSLYNRITPTVTP